MSLAALLKALWAYRSFIVGSVSREFHSRYRESLFGALWSIANPLAMIVIYTVVFGRLMRPTLPGHESTPFAFSIYLCAGVITWGLFSEMLGRLNNVFLENGNLIKKSSVPRVCFPIIVVLSALVNFLIVLLLYLIFLLVIGHWPGVVILYLTILLFIQIIFTLGFGIILGILNVFFRDVGQVTGIALQFWFWLTPIVYTYSSLPSPIKALMNYNPMFPLINAYQGLFLDQKAPDIFSLLPLVIGSLLILIMAVKFFSNRVGELVDEL